MTKPNSPSKQRRDRMQEKLDAAIAEADHDSIQMFTGMIAGHDSALKYLSELAPEFSPDKAFEEYKTLDVNHPGWSEQNGFMAGARWQHSQMAAKIGLMQEENERLQTDSIHSCSKGCQREACVQRRELAQYKLALEKAKDALKRTMICYADCISRVKTPEPWMINDIKTALVEIEEG